MYKHILIPTDGSALATTAVKQGLDFAKAVGAEVTILTVHEPFHIFTLETEMVTDTFSAYKEHAKRHAKSVLEKVQALAEARNIKCELLDLESDYPYEAIISTAKKKKCDLIAMASHGHGGVKAMILGSETQKVLAHSTIPVLVYR
ncbi:MAG: universal stress protein [Alphaproteobacteria bacterium]|jgi:nucleotide-binding universal stress UspA family protein|nr:universal stress protein [Alphaproteobacteria bacterium]